MNILTIPNYFGSIDSKLAIYKSDPEDNCCEHSHEFDEFVIVEEGHGLHVINSKPIYVRQGDVFYVQRSDHHFYDELGVLKLTNILINPSVEFTYLKELDVLLKKFSANDANCYAWLPPSQRKVCNDLISQIFSINKNSTAMWESSFFSLLTTILKSQSISHHSDTNYKLNKLLNFVQDNCFLDYDWNTLADKFHLTRRTMFRHIKAATGLTPDTYLKRLRLLSARAKILETDLKITEVAFLCGFSNSNHFSSLYKKVFGVTPSEERKRYKPHE